MGEKSNLPLFETKSAKNRFIFGLYTLSIFISICFILYFRILHLPVSKTAEKLAWLGAFFSELWFAFYWFLTIVIRWNPSYRHTFKDRLSQRYGEVFPGLDVFVCTADPVIEPPTMVVSTKMSIYLSDDGGSDLTFYALLEASRFSRKWLPFCREFNVEPRSPEAYFRKAVEPLNDSIWSEEWCSMKNSYEDMKKQIETVAELGRIPEDIRKQHKGFLEWDTVSSQRDHQTILQIVIDGRDPMALDNEGQPLPTLVYLAREKRPQYNHHFKAGAMNALIRVSSRISNAPIILNVDCDMYSNNADSVRDVLCFFMDEENGDEIGFVQFPQNFDNLTTNDLYSSSFNVLNKVELHGMDDNGGTSALGAFIGERQCSFGGL
ncbi:hypothetical protein NL676_007681 [Syzygium grande]|nr:hypothetical protein NL676_007681 [Syzygium grande]